MFSRLFLTILLYITLVFLIFIIKPSMMFDANGNLKHYDYNNTSETSLLTIEIVLPFLALLCYFIIIILEMVIDR
jgi:hypothetical protein